MRTERTIGGAQLELVQGDITDEEVDGIVNAANAGLRGGGGVDGAIHRAGGPRIMEECRMIGGCPTGDAVVTTAGSLPARVVIHAVAPVWRGGTKDEEGLLRGAYRASLERAVEKGLRSVAFPSLGTGAYGYPLDAAAPAALDEVAAFLQRHKNVPERVRFVLFDEKTFRAYAEALEGLEGLADASEHNG